MKQRVGIIGVGLMGHGIARNILKHGHPLAALEHPGNQPMDDLLEAGARTEKTARALAAQSDVIILCVTGSPEVEAVLSGATVCWKVCVPAPSWWIAPLRSRPPPSAWPRWSRPPADCSSTPP